MSGRGHPKPRLDVLREIGWRLWDPIGLFDKDNPETMARIADEYDTYLKRAAGMLRNGKTVEGVAKYLRSAERSMMGVGPADLDSASCWGVARAIAEADDLWRA